MRGQDGGDLRFAYLRPNLTQHDPSCAWMSITADFGSDGAGHLVASIGQINCLTTRSPPLIIEYMFDIGSGGRLSGRRTLAVT